MVRSADSAPVRKGISGLEFVRVIHTNLGHCCDGAPMQISWHIVNLMWLAAWRKGAALL
jgi:hypothetical protein